MAYRALLSVFLTLQQTPCLPGQAPLLTLENVFEAVKAAKRSWRKVCCELMVIVKAEELDAFRDQHGSDEEACLKAVIEDFLRGESCYQPAWRGLIHALYHVGETRIAQDIISYAEPVEGERVFDDMLDSVQYYCTHESVPPVRVFGMKQVLDRVCVHVLCTISYMTSYRL